MNQHEVESCYTSHLFSNQEPDLNAEEVEAKVITALI